MAVKLIAEADSRRSGKQFVARIIGRSEKFLFHREFVGRKTGRYNEITTAMVDVPGLYEIRDVSRDGASDRYFIVANINNVLDKTEISIDEAMEIAKNPSITKEDWSVLATKNRIKIYEKRKVEYAALPQDEKIKLKNKVGELDKGTEVLPVVVIAEYDRMLQKLQSSLEPETLESKITKVQALMDELGVTIANLLERQQTSQK